jgi:hypothetical protein
MVAPDPSFRVDRSPAPTPGRGNLARAARSGQPAPTAGASGSLAVTLLIIGLCPLLSATLALLCALLLGIPGGP